MEPMGWSKLMYVIAALITGAPLSMDDEHWGEAVATVRQYALDMNKVLPCAYLSVSDPRGKTDIVDETYGAAAARRAIVMYSSQTEDGFAESLALVQAFASTFKPRWSVKDIRVFARNCYRSKIMEDIEQVRGAAVPLALRPPFTEDIRAK